MSQSTYLAKQGKVFGPYTPKQIEELQASGKIKEYNWYWETIGDNRWKPFDPPPAPLDKGFTDRSKQRELPDRDSLHLYGICHDTRRFVSGHLGKMTDSGCDFFSEEDTYAPAFPNQRSVILNLLDEKKKKQLNVEAKIGWVEKLKQGWNYHLIWEKRPELG